jgi:isoquinoline 1-oxidoreductase alpha subunit
MKINGEKVLVPEAWREATLLTFLRDHLGLTGTKFGCGGGFCGACTIHLDGRAVRACLVPVGAVGERSVTTIESLGSAEGLHPVQRAWKELSVPQCGYCQPGQIMTAVAYLASRGAKREPPTEEEVRTAMSGNLCRCGTYTRIREAVLRAVELAEEPS